MPVNDKQLADEIIHEQSQSEMVKGRPSPPLAAHGQRVIITLLGPRRRAESGVLSLWGQWGLHLLSL